jgi:hypothetical protein
MIDPGLAGRTKQDAPAGVDQFIQFPHQSEVVFQRFAKPDARIDPQPGKLEQILKGFYF